MHLDGDELPGCDRRRVVVDCEPRGTGDDGIDVVVAVVGIPVGTVRLCRLAIRIS
jgi:hypothetical protein